MKVRKLAIALALAGGLGSGMAQALGLGEIELQSWLNEPLDAEILLRQSAGVDPGDVFVNVAPETAYQRVGLERNQFLRNLRFQVVTGADGNLAINVSSREPVREPYLNFLLELTWPNGRLMREYAVLVDPPVYAEDSGLAERVSAPAASSSPASASARQPAPRSAESVRRQADVERASARGYRADSFGPTGPSDTLWAIALRMRPDSSVSVQQVMLAIQDANPDAFMDNNINRLKRGQVLRAPTLEQIRSRSQAEANQVVVRQNQEFQSPRPVDAARTAQAQPATGAEGAATDELRLLVADDEGAEQDAGESGSAGGDGDRAGGVDAGTAVALEELEASRRENDELASRLQDMEEQVNTLQRLLELKNSQLAELQGMVADEAPVAEVPGGTDEPVADEAASDEAAADEPAADETPAAADDTATEVDDLSETAEVVPGGDESPAADPQTDEVEPGAVTAGTDDQTASEAEAAAAPAAAVSPEPVPRPEPAPTPAQAAREKGFFGQVVDAILGNPLYQIALGGGLILLLLLLLLVARNNAKREKDFYDEFNRADEDDAAEVEDLVDLGDGAEPVTGVSQPEAADALAEAEAYIAYGRNEQAIEVLETAISREPSRADLRLMLLGVYADNQNREAFEKQYGEVEALGDDSALEQAEAIRARLDEAESVPSIDDLESQLRSDSFMLPEDEPGQSEEKHEQTEEASGETEDDMLVEWSLSDELKADESESAPAETGENEFGSLESGSTEASDAEAEEDNTIEFDLSEFDLEDGDTDLTGLETDTTGKTDEDDLSLELDELELLTEPEKESGDSGPESDVFDESFLEELDAELEKATGDDVLEELDLEDTSLEELELDVSEDDLALIEEFAEDVETPAELPDLDELESELETDVPELTGDDGVRADLGLPTALDMDEGDLDDEFDFLAGTDEAATKLDLARAYIEMGDTDGARDILDEVALEGNDAQKVEAQELLKKLS